MVVRTLILVTNVEVIIPTAKSLSRLESKSRFQTMRMISTKVEIQTQVESTEGIEQVQSLPELADLINQSHLQIQRVSKVCLTQARIAGQHLLSAKEKIQHGMWLQWLQEYCPNLSDRTARAYMQVARNWEKLSSELADSADLTIDGALKLLSGKIDVVEAEIVEEADVPPPPLSSVPRSSVPRSSLWLMILLLKPKMLQVLSGSVR